MSGEKLESFWGWNSRGLYGMVQRKQNTYRLAVMKELQEDTRDAGLSSEDQLLNTSFVDVPPRYRQKALPSAGSASEERRCKCCLMKEMDTGFDFEVTDQCLGLFLSSISILAPAENS